MGNPGVDRHARTGHQPLRREYLLRGAEGVHSIGGARVTAQFLNHPALTLGYRVEAGGVAMVYLVDHEPFSDQLWRAGAVSGRIDSILRDGDRGHARFMADADLVIHDARYTPEESVSETSVGLRVQLRDRGAGVGGPGGPFPGMWVRATPIPRGLGHAKPRGARGSPPRCNPVLFATASYAASWPQAPCKPSGRSR